jgi:DNA-binding CsgD family transcriptional regulator
MTSIFRRHARGRPPHPDVLTPAEWRVLDEVREGHSNPEIAERLGLSRNTVKTHVSSILGKLELADREDLAGWRGEPAAMRSRRSPLFAVVGWIASKGGLVAISAVGARHCGRSPRGTVGRAHQFRADESTRGHRSD